MNDFSAKVNEITELLKKNNEDLQKILKEYNLLKEENKQLKNRIKELERGK